MIYGIFIEWSIADYGTIQKSTHPCDHQTPAYPGTDDNFRKAAGVPRLDLPEHLWGVRDMRSAHTREKDFMAITAEVEVLCQQLKGRGTYTIPPMTLTTSSSKSSGSVHFQPIDPAQKSSVQAMDQLPLNSSLNLLDDSPRLQSPSNNGPIQHGQAMPQVPAPRGNYPIPPTLYINQTAMDQHQRAQPTPLLPRMNLGSINIHLSRYNHHSCRTVCNHNDCLL